MRRKEIQEGNVVLIKIKYEDAFLEIYDERNNRKTLLRRPINQLCHFEVSHDNYNESNVNEVDNNTRAIRPRRAAAIAGEHCEFSEVGKRFKRR